MVIEALGLVEKGMEKSNLKIQGSVKTQELQKMNLFGTPHIPILVLTFGQKSGFLGFNTKLRGLTINDTLTWNDHIEELVKKASKKLYFLIQLKRAHVPTSDLGTYFCACITHYSDALQLAGLESTRKT